MRDRFGGQSLWLRALGLAVVLGLWVPLAEAAPEEAPEIYDDDQAQSFPALEAYRSQVAAAAQEAVPVLNLLNLTVEQKRYFTAALRSPEVHKNLRDPERGAAYRVELFTVRPFRPGDLPAEDRTCEQAGSCGVVELFNFTLTSTIIAVVTSASPGQVRSVRVLSNFQPEIPPHLQSLAIAIAQKHPAVQRRVGVTPTAKEFVMAGTKTALNKTRCERSRHLCVSATFVAGERALWTIVDLVDGRVVGSRFTRLEGSAPVPFTEQQLLDEHILKELCEKTQTVERGPWTFDYHLTSSDGLEVLNARYRGVAQFASAKNVDWHVSYSEKDGFGYSDAVGCPLFSAAAVVPARLPKIKDIVENNTIIGFELHQDFMSKLWPMPCNYYYEQRFQFFNDGRYRVAVASVGRGCGVPGWYRPVVRVAFPFSAATFSAWDGKQWAPWSTEGVELQAPDRPYTKEGYRFRIHDAAGQGVYIEPGRGQFGDQGRGDNAYTYIVRDAPGRDEGRTDLPTIGPCCNTDAQQGPERFINTPPESILGAPLVLWYVPQLVNDATPKKEYCWGTTAFVNGRIEKYEYPCIAGPMFVPFSEQPHDKD